MATKAAEKLKLDEAEAAAKATKKDAAEMAAKTKVGRLL